MEKVLAAVRAYYDLEPGALRRRHDRPIVRALAAWLCRRHTVAPLRELASDSGLLRADSVPGLVRPFEGRLRNSPWLNRDMERIEQFLATRPAAPGEPVGSGEEP